MVSIKIKLQIIPFGDLFPRATIMGFLLFVFSCPMRDCHEAKKCEGHFIDSYSMEDVEECIVTCNENDDCNW